MVHKYWVHVTRTAYAHAQVEVISPIPLTEAQVNEMAIEKAGNVVFSEKSSEYEVDFIDKKGSSEIAPDAHPF